MNKKQQTKKNNGVVQTSVPPKGHKNGLYGVRIGGYVVSIVELVASITSIISGVVLAIVGGVFMSGVINSAGRDDFEIGKVLLIIGLVLLALSILGTVISANLIGMMKYNYSKTKYTVLGILGIISLVAMAAGIMALVVKCNCKEMQ